MCCNSWGHKESDTFEGLNRLASPNISVITLSVSELNTLTKRHRVATWIKKKKKDSTICRLQETTSDLRTLTYWASLVAQMVKHLSAMRET